MRGGTCAYEACEEPASDELAAVGRVPGYDKDVEVYCCRRHLAALRSDSIRGISFGSSFDPSRSSG